MQQVGVEAVVKNLSSFLADIGKMNTGLKSLDTSGNVISRTISAVGDGFKSLGSSMVRVAEVALGVLVRDAFNAVISGLGEIVTSTIEAGAGFQIMQLRLQRLNFNDLIDSGVGYKEAMRGAVELTKDNLNWIQKLAVTTPFDAQDIANVYTLARSYGFASEASQKLTQDISDFSAGMGLGNTEIERIIVNFGQMVQQGKVTSREMNDLARGAFVPVNDVLKRMQENVGLTDAQFEKFRYTGEGVNAFMEAFSQIVEERFSGATRQMARTFKGATDNAKDFIQSLLGMGVVRPVLDAVGGTIADLIDSLTTPERWDALTTAAGKVGAQLSNVVTGVLGLLPSTENLADNIVSGLEGLAGWIADHKTDIVGFFQNIGDTIQNDVIPFVTDKLIPAIQDFGTNVGDTIQNKIVPFINDTLVPAFEKISTWATENGPQIEEFFGALGDIVGDVFTKLSGVDLGEGGGLDTLLSGISTFMQYVVDNKDNITNLVATLATLWGILQVIGFVLTLVLPPFIALAGIILSVAGVVIGATAIFQGLAAILAVISLPVLLLVAAIALLVYAFIQAWNFGAMLGDGLAMIFLNIILPAVQNTVEAVETSISTMVEIATGAWQDMVTDVTTAAQDIYSNVVGKFEEIKTSITGADWPSIGSNMMTGIKKGIVNAAQAVVDAVAAAVQAAIDKAKALLDSFSPSRVFMELGANTMEGMAIGITKSMGMASDAMEKAMLGVVSPALSVPTVAASGAVSTVNNYTNNYNLSISTSAQAEPIVQDFNMLQSLAGAG